MTVESVTYIDDLNASNPAGTDAKSEGDDHIRNLKTGIKNSFPNIDGAMTSTQAELNTLDGYTGNTADLNVLSGADAGGLTAAELLYVADVTSAIQVQLDAKMTGSNNLSDLTDTHLAHANLELDTIGADHLYLGTGDLGAVTYTTNTTLDSGEYHYTDMTLNVSQTLDVTEANGGFLILRATGTVTITGDIDLDGKGSAGGAGGTGTNGTGTAGGSGTGGALGGSGGGSNTGDGGDGGSSIFRGSTASGVAGATATNGNGTVGSTMDAKFTRALNYIIDPVNYTGSGGGGGGANSSAIVGGDGGTGGGTLIIVADTIDFQTGANITCDGTAGDAPNTIGGGGGGGAGGTVLFVSNTLTNDGTITVTGGAGGAPATGGDGGAGGAGTSLVITL